MSTLMLRWPERHGYGYHSDHLLLDFSIVTVFLQLCAPVNSKSRMLRKAFNKTLLGVFLGFIRQGIQPKPLRTLFAVAPLKAVQLLAACVCTVSSISNMLPKRDGLVVAFLPHDPNGRIFSGATAGCDP